MSYAEPEPRGDVYIWVTWLTKLLAGENACEWATWFRARHKFTKLDSGFDLERWIREHDDLVSHRAKQLESDGYSVYLEDRNSFTLRGSNSGATIAGKPDIVAIKDDEAIFEDCKTGKKRRSDHVQVALYMLLARHLTQFKPVKAISGRVVYLDGPTPIDEEIVVNLTERLADLVGRICDPIPPVPRPSLNECGYCDISDFYCPQRINNKSNSVYITDLF